jgi:hypothetical protein
MVAALRKLQTEFVLDFYAPTMLGSSHHLFGDSELWVSIHGSEPASRTFLRNGSSTAQVANRICSGLLGADRAWRIFLFPVAIFLWFDELLEANNDEH